MAEPYTNQEKEIEHLREQLAYERRERYAAEMALNRTQDVGRSDRPERVAQSDLEYEQCPD